MYGSKIIQNSDYFRQIIENSGDVIWSLDISTMRLTYVSPSIYKLNGYTSEEMLSSPLEKFISPKSLQFIIDELPKKVEAVLQGDLSKKYNVTEVEQYIKGGGIVETEVVTTIIFNNDNVPVEVFGVSRNISQRKHIEKLVRVLNDATILMQVAMTPEEIYNTLSNELKKWDINSSVFTWDEDRRLLCTRYLSWSDDFMKAAETLARISAADFTIKVDDCVEYQQVIFCRKTVMISDPESFIRNLLPKAIRMLASQIIRLLKVPSFIIAPLIYNDTVKGILTLQSPLLNESDKPAVSMFAYHLAASWHRGELFEQYKRETEARKNAEQELYSQGLKYKNTLNWSPIGIYQSTRDGQIISVNESFAEMLGYGSEDELVGRVNMAELYYHKEDRNTYVNQYFEGGDSVSKNVELLWKKKDESPIWILLTVHSIFNEKNEFVCYEGFVQNIEKQKKINLDLEESLSQIKATLESTNDGILVVNNEGKVTNYNSRFAELWGIPQETTESREDKVLLNFVRDSLKDPEQFYSRVEELYSLPEIDGIDIIELKDGRVFERYSHPQRHNNRVEARVWSFRDVTDKLKAMEALQKTKNQYRVLFEGANDSIFIVKDNKFIDCNEMTLNIFECDSKDQVIGKYPWEFSPEYQPDGTLSKDKASIVMSDALNGNPQRFYWSHITAKGKLIDCEISLNRIMFEKESFLQAIVRDITEHLAIVSAIRVSEAKFRNIFESSPMGMALVGPDLKLKTVNSAFVTMIGYSPEELGNMTFKDITHPDNLEEDMLNVQKMISGERSDYHTEKKYIRKNGSTAWCSTIITTVHDSAGKLTHFMGIVDDITSRKTAELALAESQSLYSSVVDNSNDVIIIYQDEKIKFVNPAIEELTGINPEELIDKNILELINKDEHHKAEYLFQQREKGTESTGIFEVPMTNKEGKMIPVELNISEIVFKSAPADLIFIRDLSERQKAEKEIREREYWLSESQKIARIGTYYFDAGSNTWKCTETLDEIFGIGSDYPKNTTSWSELIYEEDRQYMLTYLTDYVILKKNPFNKEYRVIRKNDGQVRWVLGRGDLIFDEDGRTLAMIGTISDIHERKIMEEELKYAKEKAEESSRLKSSLLLNISHELRTPMNGILGFAEVLNDSLQDPVLKRMADNIYYSGNRLKSTLDSIVDLSQVQADAKIIKIEDIDVAGEVTLALTNFEDIAVIKKIKVETALEQGLMVKADQKMLSNVLYHLIDNALKFTDNGIVKISSRHDKQRNRVVVSVRDTGIGIALEHLEMVFDEFRQVSEGMGRAYEGTGLGLTLCKKFVTLMHGDITVDSELGVGSDFCFSLPWSEAVISKETIIGKEMNHDKMKEPGHIPVVLLVEDQEYNLELIEIYLQDCCETDRALDGLTAVKMAYTRQYDAILMDVNLGPGIDGLEATSRIKSIKGYENTPIIAVTGYTTVAEREHILNHGCTHYISKPYNKAKLLSVISEAITMSR